MKTSTHAWALLLGFLAQAPAGGALPTGDAVIARYVEAIGGVAANDAIRNRVIHGRMEILGANVVLGMTVYSARPDRNYTLVESEVTGRIESGVSDGVVWETSAMRGAVIKEGAERDDVLRDATFDRLVHWKDHLKSAECTGTADVNGKPAYRVVATPKVGSAQALHFEKESGLLVRIETTVNSAAGPVQVVAEPGDFRKVDGVLMAFTSRIDVMGQRRVVTVERVEQNVDLPADRFAPPPGIKALIRKE